MTDIHVEVTGVKETRDMLFKLANTFPDAACDALYQEMNAIAKVAMRRTPMRFGNLRGSQYVRYPEYRNQTIQGEIGYTASYAAAVHEMLGRGSITAGGISYSSGIHWSQPGTGPKYLEGPALEHAPKMISNMVRRINAWIRAGGQFGLTEAGNQIGGRFL